MSNLKVWKVQQQKATHSRYELLNGNICVSALRNIHYSARVCARACVQLCLYIWWVEFIKYWNRQYYSRCVTCVCVCVRAMVSGRKRATILRKRWNSIGHTHTRGIHTSALIHINDQINHGIFICKRSTLPLAAWNMKLVWRCVYLFFYSLSQSGWCPDRLRGKCLHF